MRFILITLTDDSRVSMIQCYNGRIAPAIWTVKSSILPPTWHNVSWLFGGGYREEQEAVFY
jgi:hypothetical protein